MFGYRKISSKRVGKNASKTWARGKGPLASGWELSPKFAGNGDK